MLNLILDSLWWHHWKLQPAAAVGLKQVPVLERPSSPGLIEDLHPAQVVVGSVNAACEPLDGEGRDVFRAASM